MDQATLERLLIRSRYLFTRGATVRLGLRDAAAIKSNEDAFIRECHRVYKKAQKTLIEAMLEIERDVAQVSRENKNSPLLHKYKHWLRILESCFESFVWLAFRPSDIPHLYKGPKFGSLVAQNVESVLTLVSKFNESPYVFAVPLDFTRFSCTGDLLHIERHPGTRRIAIAEVKQGDVNDAMLNAAKARDQAEWMKFFDDYGEKGIQQTQRYFRQEQEYHKRAARMTAEAGIHKDEDGTRLVLQSETALEDFIEIVEALCQNARCREYAVDTVDDCLMIAAVDMTSEQRCALGQFNARLFVLNAYIAPEASEKYSPSQMSDELQKIKLTDWLEGLGSVRLIPLFKRPLSTRTFLDLAFGRIRLLFFFHPPTFIRLCQEAGVQADLISKKATNRLRSTQQLRSGEIPLYQGCAIGYRLGDHTVVLGSAGLHEVIFNWMRPRSFIAQLADAVSGAKVSSSPAGK
jgi:hypothetical protein